MAHTALDELARGLTTSAPGPFAFVGIGMCVGGRSSFHIATAPKITADADTYFRVASISKVVVGAAFAIAASDAGIAPPYSVDAAPLLGLDLCHPQFPDCPVTLGMFLTHTAGLSDDGGYSFPQGIAAGWDDLHRFGPHKPGSYFSYSNLGFILLGAAVERLAGQRLDHFAAAHVLAPQGIAGGLNWSGVSAQDRKNGLPIYRRDNAGFVPQIDADVPASGVIHPMGGTIDDAAYRLADDTGLLSPQGGMRTTLRGMLTLARYLATPSEPLWRQHVGDGDYLDGVFAHYGAGLQYFDTPAFYPRPLVGHFGNAYGFNGGVWYDAAAGAAFTYALNGLPLGEESDAFSAAELAIFRAIASQCEAR